MRVTELINQLTALYENIGEDVEVLITDGFEARCYSGDYSIVEWKEDDGSTKIDIGIGGCLE